MSFVDLIPPKDDSISFSRIKQDQQKEIERKTSEFIALGGAVKQIPPGECATTEENRPNRNEYTGELSVAEFKARENSRKKQQKKMKTKPTNDFGDW